MQSPDICKYESIKHVASRSRWNDRNGKNFIILYHKCLMQQKDNNIFLLLYHSAIFNEHYLNGFVNGM